MTDQALPARLTASLAAALISRSARIDAANETMNEAGKDRRDKKTRRGERRRRDREELRLGPQGRQRLRRRRWRHRRGRGQDRRLSVRRDDGPEEGRVMSVNSLKFEGIAAAETP